MYALYLTLDNTMSYNTVIANKKEDTYEIIKKIVSLLTVTALVTSLTACGSSNEKSGSGSSDKKTYKIGICQLVEHEALDAATKGFKSSH